MLDQSILPVPLQDRFLEIDGWQWGSFTNADGARLRYGGIDPPGRTIATAIALPGFGGFAEQWFELFRDLIARGIAVRHLDWRGQGGSERYLANTHKMHSLGYARDVRDLHRFVTEVAQYDPSQPLFALAHSMGGHIALRYLCEEPGRFKAAFLTAPMIGINTERASPAAIAAVARTMTAGGFGARYLLGHSDWWFREHYPVEESRLSQDPVRYRVAQLYYRLMPELRIGGGTWRWLAESFRSVKHVNAAHTLGRVRTPVYIASAGLESIVSNAAQARAARLIPSCFIETYPTAKHDMWMEHDAVREPLLRALERFVEERVVGRNNPTLTLPMKGRGHDVRV